jgi:small conductance mechanosensitive channel
VSLTAYLASASVIGLAIGFGSQGLVQDVVTGLTLVFSNLIDVGDMVEIGGQTGVIRSIGMRFTVLENALGAEVFIPNRSIANVINYPRGYVRCIVDVTLPATVGEHDSLEAVVKNAMDSFVEQFPGILVYPPSIEGKQKTVSSKEFLRVKFRIFPGRGVPLESTFKQELLQRFKSMDPSYADWMISVYYEVEKDAKKYSG